MDLPTVKNVGSFNDLPLPRLKYALSAYKEKLVDLYIGEEKKKGRGLMMITLAEQNRFDCAFIPLKMIDKPDIQDAVVSLSKKAVLFIAKEDGKVVSFSLPRDGGE